MVFWKTSRGIKVSGLYLLMAPAATTTSTKVTKQRLLHRCLSNRDLGNIELNLIDLHWRQGRPGKERTQVLVLLFHWTRSHRPSMLNLPKSQTVEDSPHIWTCTLKAWTEINHGMLRKKESSNCKKLPVTSTPFSSRNRISSSLDPLKIDESVSAKGTETLPDFGIVVRTITNIFSSLLFFGAVVTSLRLSHFLSLPIDWFW